MGRFSLFLIMCLSWGFFILGTHQLQSSQTQVLVQLRKHLEYPNELEIWNDHTVDFCFVSSKQVNITCQNNFVTELKITGNKPSKVGNFSGSAIPGQTLSANFSMDSFVATLSRLTSLRVLSLVSLGIWGQLPDKIHRLYSLQFLDLTSNFLFGSIPPKISRLAMLETLSLDLNFFNGTIPDSLVSLSNLTVLTLSKNHLSGSLPKLSSLRSLKNLDVSENKLSSELPVMPNGLVVAFLSNNSFTGHIPQQYSQLGQLQNIDLSFNSLKGTPPGSLFSLQNITYLNLSSNMLSGSLPNHLICGRKLVFVDISDNRFVGELPNCLNNGSKDQVVKFGGNCLSEDLSHQNPVSNCVEFDVKKAEPSGRNVGILVGVIGGVFLFVVLLCCGCVVICRAYCPRGTSEQHLLHKAVQDNSAIGFSSGVLTSARFISEASKLGTRGVPVCRLFTLEELKEATNNFNKSTFMGGGSIGKLYKGRLENGTSVAIRCVSLSNKYSIRNLRLRLDLLWKLRHPHLVCLLGHCIDGSDPDNSGVNKVFLVYEYVPNGNFHALLSENSLEKGIKWSERLAVLIGVAKAVHFLHTGIIPGFSRNQLKTHNILLNDHKMAKLSDYGLSIITEAIDRHEAKGGGPNSWEMETMEDDVYRFGFILLESLAGPTVSERREAFLVDEMASFGSQDGRRQIVDPSVLTTSSQESLSIVISLTNKCVSSDPSTRPSFEDVLWNLQYAAQVQATADGSDISSLL